MKTIEREIEDYLAETALKKPYEVVWDNVETFEEMKEIMKSASFIFMLKDDDERHTTLFKFLKPLEETEQ